jgi:formylglycine-generating enzyme required for sulfatase activity
MVGGCSESPTDPGEGETETGTVVVDTEPDALDAPWELEGPGTYAHSGSGDATLSDLEPGDYLLTWSSVAGYVMPDPGSGTLTAGETLTFAGTYLEDGGFEPPEMITVSSGTFVMGHPATWCGDEHQVTLTHDFYLGRYEITNQEYVQAIQWAYDHDYVTASTASVHDHLDGSTEELARLNDANCEISFSDGVFSCVNSDNPVIFVSWYGAARYCDWLSLMSGFQRAYEHSGDWLCNDNDAYEAEGYRLPTDAEWEYAAQYSDDRIYPWGNGYPNCALANIAACVGWTSPVGSYAEGNSALGFSDMAANVWEWCNDRHTCDLGIAAVIDPVGPTTGTRVLHGGSWTDGGNQASCAYRVGNVAVTVGWNLGFRAARTASS